MMARAVDEGGNGSGSAGIGSIAISIASLLPPQQGTQPFHYLPSPASAVLGPSPPSAPLHVALEYLEASDLSPFENAGTSASASASASAGDHVKGKGKDNGEGEGEADSGINSLRYPPPARVLIVTGNKDSLYHSLQEDDEDWLRDNGSEYGVMARLKRIDIRYCPSAQHVLLLLSLLTAQTSASASAPASTSTGVDGVYRLPIKPGLVILYDIAGTMMHWEAGDENAEIAPAAMGGMETDDAQGEGQEPRMVFNEGVVLSQYLDIISAARDTIRHLDRGTQLIILEPNLDTSSSSLPILPVPKLPSRPIRRGETGAKKEERGMNEDGESETDPVVLAVPTQSRSKRIKLVDGLVWMFGKEAVGKVVSLESSNINTDLATHTLHFPYTEETGHYMLKRRCGRGEWASHAGRDEVVDGDQGGWRWEWA